MPPRVTLSSYRSVTTARVPVTVTPCRSFLLPRSSSGPVSTQRPSSKTCLFHTVAQRGSPASGRGFRTYTTYCAALLAAIVSLGVYSQRPRQRLLHLEAPPSGDSLTTAARVEIAGKDHDESVDQVPTGTEKVPYFPRIVWLPRSGGAKIEGQSAALPAGIGPAQEEEEYHLLGLGVRTVSFLSIQVYVVGVYVAKSDLGQLQHEMVKVSVPEGSAASTLVQGEKDDLRKRLLSGADSEKIWEKVLKEGQIRSAVRVVPVRDTNFAHLRDGWIRGIDLRGKTAEFSSDDFKSSVNEFKTMLGGGGSVAKGKVLLLGRGRKGDLRAWVEEGLASKASKGQIAAGFDKDRMTLLGRVDDERVSRLVWMGYLAGNKVASEPARQSVIDGVMEVVERPSGTLETQVL